MYCSGCYTGQCNVPCSPETDGSTMAGLKKYRMPTLVQITLQRALLAIPCYGCVHNLFLGPNNIHDMYCSSTIVRVIKSRRMRWAGHVAHMGGEERRVQGFGGET